MYKTILIALFLVFAAAGFASTSYAGPTLDSDVQLKLARFKARQKLEWSKLSGAERKRRLERRDAADGGTPCGAIDLGNVRNATITRSPREITVIIDGDVINANNHCR